MSETYLQETARTHMKLDEVRKDIFPTHTRLGAEVATMIMSGYHADLIKRSLFYKESVEKSRDRSEGYKLLDRQTRQKLSEVEVNFDEKSIDLIHAAIGMMSEAAEILQEVIDANIEGREIDVVNIKEELGDNQWYAALGLRTVGGTFEEVQTGNAEKLKKRYPEKFNASEALERDVAEERIVLENKFA